MMDLAARLHIQLLPSPDIAKRQMPLHLAHACKTNTGSAAIFQPSAGKHKWDTLKSSKAYMSRLQTLKRAARNCRISPRGLPFQKSSDLAWGSSLGAQAMLRALWRRSDLNKPVAIQAGPTRRQGRVPLLKAECVDSMSPCSRWTLLVDMFT